MYATLDMTESTSSAVQSVYPITENYYSILPVATLRKLLWSSSLSQIMQHWTSQHFLRDILVDLIFLGEVSAQESATVSVAPTGFVIFSSICVTLCVFYISGIRQLWPNL